MFDIEAIKNTITSALQVLYNDNYPEIKLSIDDYLMRMDDRLALVATSGLTGQIDPDFFAARMKDELTLLESELISLQILGVDIIQDAIHKAISEALKLITPALPDNTTSK